MLNIPNKSHFKMNEVCGLTGVKPYVLRFWETEFEAIDPILSSSGQKLYEHKDIEAIALIKKMLFDEKLNIEKAKAEISLRMASQNSTENSSEVTPETVCDDSEITTTASDQLISRMELSESDIKDLNEAKGLLRNLLAKTDSLKSTHQWS